MVDDALLRRQVDDRSLLSPVILEMEGASAFGGRLEPDFGGVSLRRLGEAGGVANGFGESRERGATRELPNRP